MKQFIFNIFLIIFFLSLLFCSDIVFQNACNGLLLWFDILLPSLLPFLILSSLLVNTSALNWLIKFISPLICRLFRVSIYGSYAVLCGFLCGFPMGAKTTVDLLKTDKISTQEACYLISFCNNTSPMFIISYVFQQTLGHVELLKPSLCILYISPILCSFLFRIYYRKTYDSHHFFSDQKKQEVRSSTGFLIDECIMKSFETITKIGGYIILFSILYGLCSSFFDTNLLAFLEITNGISFILQNNTSFTTIYILTLALISFGGCCAIAQTASILSDSRVPLFPYIIEKLITAMVTSFLAFIFMKFF